MSEHVPNLETYSGKKTMDYVVGKYVEMVEITTYIHERVEVMDK